MKIIDNNRAMIICKDAFNIGLGVFNCRKNTMNHFTEINGNLEAYTDYFKVD